MHCPIQSATARRRSATRLLRTPILQHINDEFFDVPTADNAYLTVAVPRLTVVYEDKICFCRQAARHPRCTRTAARASRTLMTTFWPHLYQKASGARVRASFTPLCNRIDRNTGGIVIAAKTAEALRVMNQKIKDRELDKRYLAVEGTPRPRRRAEGAFCSRTPSRTASMRPPQSGRADLRNALPHAGEPQRAVAQAKEIKDISGLTHGIGWCAPQQGACKLTLNIKDGIIEEALVETIGCSGMTHPRPWLARSSSARPFSKR